MNRHILFPECGGYCSDFDDQMATQDIKRSPKLHHGSTQQIRKTIAVQHLLASFITAGYGNNAIGKDEVASSNLASSSKITVDPIGSAVFLF